MTLLAHLFQVTLDQALVSSGLHAWKRSRKARALIGLISSHGGCPCEFIPRCIWNFPVIQRWTLFMTEYFIIPMLGPTVNENDLQYNVQRHTPVYSPRATLTLSLFQKCGVCRTLASYTCTCFSCSEKRLFSNAIFSNKYGTTRSRAK